jgi:hypothetical protein
MIPLYEGQMANMFDHRSRTYEGYQGGNKYGKKPDIPWVSDAKKANPWFEVEPRFWIDAQAVQRRLTGTVGDRCLVGYRYTGRPWQDRRTARAALLPCYPSTGKLPVIAVPRDTVFRFLAYFNSTAFDFMLRSRLAGSSISKSILEDCPFPGLALVPDSAARIASKLSLTSNSVASAYGWEVEDYGSLEVRRRLLAEMDAMVALGLGLSELNYSTIQQSFRLEILMESCAYEVVAVDVGIALVVRVASLEVLDTVEDWRGHPATAWAKDAERGTHQTLCRSE